MIERLLGLCNYFYDVGEADFDAKLGETLHRTGTSVTSRSRLADPVDDVIHQNKKEKSHFGSDMLSSHAQSSSDSEFESSEATDEKSRHVTKKGEGLAKHEMPEPTSRKFVINTNKQINEIVEFLENILIRDTFDGAVYQGFDRFQKLIVDATCSLFLQVKPESVNPGRGTIRHEEFKPKRRDEKTKIIMSIILKSIIRTYKKKLVIPKKLRRKNLYLAVYYHFAYQGEDYKLVGQLPDRNLRYRLAEEAFKTRRGMTKPFVQSICPALLLEILEVGSNVEYLENAYTKRVSSILCHLFKRFDKRQLIDNEIEEFRLERPEENMIPSRIFFTIMKRLTAKTSTGVSSCKIPLALRFIREYAEYTVQRIIHFQSQSDGASII